MRGAITTFTVHHYQKPTQGSTEPRRKSSDSKTRKTMVARTHVESMAEISSVEAVAVAKERAQGGQVRVHFRFWSARSASRRSRATRSPTVWSWRVLQARTARSTTATPAAKGSHGFRMP